MFILIPETYNSDSKNRKGIYKMKRQREQNITKVLLAVYCFVLVWIILFKMNMDFSVIGYYRNINLIPFKGSVITNGRISTAEIMLNVLIFVPFGVYISMLKEDWNFICKAAPVFCTSLSFEVLQYVLGIGATDITDLLGNTLGGIIGILLFGLLSKLLKENTIKFINITAAIGTVLIMGLLILLIVANR